MSVKIITLILFNFCSPNVRFFKPLNIDNLRKQNMRQPQQHSNKFQNRSPFYWHPGTSHPPPHYFPPLHPHRTLPHESFNYSKQNQFQSIVKQEENFVKIQENRHPTFYGIESGLMPQRDDRFYDHNNQNQEMYWNYFIHYKKPYTEHRAFFFDPSAAPLITSEFYNHIEDFSRDQKRIAQMKEIPQKDLNQLKFGQHDENPFITYRFRRIKKKYKKYLSISDQSLCSFDNNEESEKDNSQSSGSLENQDRHEMSEISQRPRKRRRKQRRRVTKRKNFAIENAYSINLSYVSIGKT